MGKVRALALCMLTLLLLRPVAGEEGCDCGDDVGASAAGDSTYVAESSPLLDVAGDVADALRARLGGGRRVALDLFVMSLCPYGMEAEQLLVPLVARFPDEVVLNIHFIADESAPESDSATPADVSVAPADGAESGRQADFAALFSPPTPDPARKGCAAGTTTGDDASSGDGPYRSLHGQPEIDESQRQLVIREDYPRAFMPYLLCRSRLGPTGDWRRCAEAVGLSPEAIDEAASGPRGHRLFGDDIQLASQLGVDLSPTLFIDGDEYAGRLDPFAVARAICAADPAGALCEGLPVCGSDDDCRDGEPGTLSVCLDPERPTARCQYRAPVEFELTVLTAAACELCDPEQFLGPTRRLFPGARILHVDAESPAGKALVARYGVELLPGYIFDGAFARTARFSRVRHLLRDAGDAFILSRGIAATTYWPQRRRLPGRIDLFVTADRGMPRATERWTLEAEEDLLRTWGRPLLFARHHPDRDVSDIRLHRILRGPITDEMRAETERRACLLAHQPGVYVRYAVISNRVRRRQLADDAGAPADWRAVADESGVALPALDRCLVSGEGGRLTAAAAALADSLQLATNSVSVLVDNRTLVRRPGGGGFRQSMK